MALASVVTLPGAGILGVAAYLVPHLVHGGR
jgi:hypothetical protein